ncbi:hypothetical protein BH10CYA1_BH10CYA1_58600 [soil metagenome]
MLIFPVYLQAALPTTIGTKETRLLVPWAKGNSHIKEYRALVAEVRTKSKCPFLIHDLRRTFLTMPSLDVPHYALKKLANHIPANDVTDDYIVIDVERLRVHMCRITDQFLALLFHDINDWR